MKRRTTVYIVLFLVIPFLLASWALRKPLETALQNRIADTIQINLSLTGVRVENLEKMLNCVTSLTMNKTLISLFKSTDSHSPYETATFMRSIISTASTSYFVDTENEVTVLDLSDSLYTNWVYGPQDGQALRNTDWYRACIASRGEFQWYYGKVKHQYQPESSMICVARQIDEFKYDARYGVVLVGVPLREFRLILNAIEYHESQMILADRSGAIISHNDPASNGGSLAAEPYFEHLTQKHGYTIQTVNGVKSLVVFRTLKFNGWKIIQIEPYGAFWEIEYMRTMNLLAQIGVLIFFTIVSAFIAARITRPLRTLRNEMINLSEKDMQAEVSLPIPDDKKARDEIADLQFTYRKMLLRIQRLVHNVREEQMLKENIRFQFLQAQINAHFILNAVNNIKFLAYVNHATSVGEMLASLGALLEQSLGRDDPVISLEQELIYLDNYVRLRKIGMEGSLEIVVNIPDELKNCAVLTFMLQPIIENCLQHGMDPLQGGSRIFIGAIRVGADVIIRIQDNGGGIAPDALDALRKRLESASPPHRKESLGLKNISDRISITYGKGYGLSIESQLGNGTTVIVRIPYAAYQRGEDTGRQIEKGWTGGRFDKNRYSG